MSEQDNTPETEAEAAEGAEAVAAAHEETEKGFDQLEAELEDLRERFLRAAADAENTRKRAEKEIKETREYAVSRFAGDMLGVADNLSRALESARRTAGEETSDAMKALIEGVEMTERVLQSALSRHGVAPIDPQPGETFDPHRHQAAAQIPSEHANGTIAAVMQPGYIIGARVLRAAMVAVSAGQPAGQDAPKTDDAPGGQVDLKA
jgi:molecular chaperone GrpE